MAKESNSMQPNVVKVKESVDNIQPIGVVAPSPEKNQKEAEPIKQDSNETLKGEDNKTLSALEAQILDGKSVADLEETAAGGNSEDSHHTTAGKYAEKLTLSVTSTDGRVESNTADGYIVDNDDFVTVSSSIAATPFDYSGFTGPINYSSADLGSNVAEKNKTIDTGDGDDTVRLTDGSMEYLTINTGDGNDRVEFANNSNLMVNHVTINTGAGDDVISFTDKTMNGKPETVHNEDCIHNSIIDGGDGLDTLQVSSEAPFPSYLSFLSCKNIEIVDITNVPHYDYFYIDNEDGSREKRIYDGSYPRLDGWDGYIDLGDEKAALLNHEGVNIKISHSPSINFDPLDGHPTLVNDRNPLSEIVDLIDRFNDSTHELFLKSDVEGHNLQLWGQDHAWVGSGWDKETNIVDTFEKLGITRTKGEDTYRLDFDYNHSHYSLTCSNTIGIEFVKLDVPYIGL